MTADKDPAQRKSELNSYGLEEEGKNRHDTPGRCLFLGCCVFDALFEHLCEGCAHSTNTHSAE